MLRIFAVLSLILVGSASAFAGDHFCKSLKNQKFEVEKKLVFYQSEIELGLRLYAELEKHVWNASAAESVFEVSGAVSAGVFVWEGGWVLLAKGMGAISGNTKLLSAKISNSSWVIIGTTAAAAVGGYIRYTIEQNQIESVKLEIKKYEPRLRSAIRGLENLQIDLEDILEKNCSKK